MAGPAGPGAKALMLGGLSGLCCEALPLLGPCCLCHAGLNVTAPVTLGSYPGPRGHVTYLGISTSNALLEVMLY